MEISNCLGLLSPYLEAGFAGCAYRKCHQFLILFFIVGNKELLSHAGWSFWNSGQCKWGKLTTIPEYWDKLHLGMFWMWEATVMVVEFKNRAMLSFAVSSAQASQEQIGHTWGSPCCALSGPVGGWWLPTQVAAATGNQLPTCPTLLPDSARDARTPPTP